MDWKQYIDRDQIIGWRRHLHQYPEIAFQETKTSQYICDVLEGLEGIEILRPADTSVVGVLKGGKPGKVVGLRADIDALPMQEEVDLPFKSVNPGVMHSCGHDVHTATLLGVASVLSKIRDQLSGTVKFIFQAAEEQFPGGAKGIVESGAVNDCDYFLGSHVLSGTKTGLVSCWPGSSTATPDKFTLKINGKGAHGAAPETSIDVVTIAAQVVTNLNSIVSRNISPHDSVVLSVTRMVVESSLNILASTAELGGTIRTKDETVRSYVHQRLKKVVAGICDAYDATYELDIISGYAPIINDEYLTSVVHGAVKELYGEEALVNPRKLMAGDDFSAFGKVAPTAFFLIGSGSPEEGYENLVHHPKFIANEDILSIGCEIFVACVLKLLG